MSGHFGCPPQPAHSSPPVRRPSAPRQKGFPRSTLTWVSFRRRAGGEGSAARGRRLIPPRPPGRAGGAAGPRGARGAWPRRETRPRRRRPQGAAWCTLHQRERGLPACRVTARCPGTGEGLDPAALRLPGRSFARTTGCT